MNESIAFGKKEVNKDHYFMTKYEATKYLKWVKKYFVEIGDMWTNRHPYNKSHLYTDEELYDYYQDYLNGNYNP